MAVSARFSNWAELDSRTRSDIVATALERARLLEPRLNAFVAIEDELGAPVKGPLANLPYAAKDIFSTKNHRPSGGLTGIINYPFEGEAEALRCLDQAGGRRIGFTAMTALAYEPSGHNSFYGRTRNPWNLDFITGGSSSGSAAAVASGTVVVALGSDTGGSLRIPAHCCGVTAWKPTYGIVSVSGALPLAPTLDTIGLLARSASDMQPAMDVLAGNHLPPTSNMVTSAVVIKDVLDQTEPSVRNACQQGIDAVESCGVKLERATALSAIEAIDAHALIIMQAEAVRVHSAQLDNTTLDDSLKKRLSKGLTIDDKTLSASRSARARLADGFKGNVLGGADVALLPVMAIRTPLASETDPSSSKFSPRTLYELSRLTRFVNMLGYPAISIPVGFDDHGLPVGLQIVGRPGNDRSLLALAGAIQANTDWHARVPRDVTDIIAGMRGIVS